MSKPVASGEIEQIHVSLFTSVFNFPSKGFPEGPVVLLKIIFTFTSVLWGM